MVVYIFSELQACILGSKQDSLICILNKFAKRLHKISIISHIYLHPVVVCVKQEQLSIEFRRP